jgi:hypothetical protein
LNQPIDRRSAVFTVKKNGRSSQVSRNVMPREFNFRSVAPTTPHLRDLLKAIPEHQPDRSEYEVLVVGFGAMAGIASPR